MPRELLLKALARNDLHLSPSEAKSLLTPAINLLLSLCSNSPCLERPLLEIVLRAIETRILADEELINLARLWPIYLGKEESIIRSRLSALLATEPPPELVAYIRSCLRSRAGGNSSKASITMDIIEAIFDRISKNTSYQSQLRCEVCGYHFRMQDLGQQRRDAAIEMGLLFSPTLAPGRSVDPYKPTETTGKTKPLSLLTLEIDHVTPESGFGWTDVDNLRVCCTHCNRGRSYYRRPQEPMPVSVASSLMLSFEKTQHSMMKQHTVVSAIASAGRCSSCKVSRHQRELTVRPQPKHVSERGWFVPWNLDVYCYACAPAD